MSVQPIDLFKFVSLRAAEPLPQTMRPAGPIRDGRIKLIERYPLPDVTTDAEDFSASAAGGKIHELVQSAVEALGSTAEIPAANRAIASYLARTNLSVPKETAARIGCLSARLDRSEYASVAELAKDIKLAIADMQPGWTPPNYVQPASGQSISLWKVDLDQTFDRLYWAFIAKQVRALNLESWIDALQLLYLVGCVHGLAGCPALTGSEDIETARAALPSVHPMFSLLVAYYRPFNTIRPIGIGDLLVVKQFLQSYERGEIAHVENVLSGERKVRQHRILDRTEDVLTLETETTEETTRELQTTERYELKSETESTIANDLNVEMSGQVSGRYGVVEVSASAGVAYSLSTTDARRSSNNFAKDVIDRSLSRIQRRVREERVSKRTHEVEETNTHELSGPSNGNLAGIYRWLDKRYKAQVYNYGKRLMFEFVLPEPAAFIMQAFARAERPSSRPEIPQPPAKPSLVVSQITQATVDTYADIFPLGHIDPEPAPTMSVSRVFTGSGLGGETASSHESSSTCPRVISSKARGSPARTRA